MLTSSYKNILSEEVLDGRHRGWIKAIFKYIYKRYELAVFSPESKYLDHSNVEKTLKTTIRCDMKSMPESAEKYLFDIDSLSCLEGRTLLLEVARDLGQVEYLLDSFFRFDEVVSGDGQTKHGLRRESESTDISRSIFPFRLAVFIRSSSEDILVDISKKAILVMNERRRLRHIDHSDKRFITKYLRDVQKMDGSELSADAKDRSSRDNESLPGGLDLVRNDAEPSLKSLFEFIEWGSGRWEDIDEEEYGRKLEQAIEEQGIILCPEGSSKGDKREIYVNGVRKTINESLALLFTEIVERHRQSISYTMLESLKGRSTAKTKEQQVQALRRIIDRKERGAKWGMINKIRATTVYQLESPKDYKMVVVRYRNPSTL